MFHTQMKNGVTFLTAGALASDGIRHGFSTRLGGAVTLIIASLFFARFL